MGIFDRFENAVERGVNGAFSRVFRSGIKAVDVTSALKRAMDDHVQELSTDRAIAPNHFTIRMAPADMNALGDLEILSDEFVQQATDYAQSQGYSTSPKIATNLPVSSRFKHATNAVQQPRRRPRPLHPNTPSLTSTEKSGSSPNPSLLLAVGPRPTLPSPIREFPAVTWNFVSLQPALSLPIWARQMVPSSKDTASTRRPFLTETRSPSAAPESCSGHTRKVRMPSDF